MKEYFIKRQRIIHLLSLVAIVASVFLQDFVFKLSLLLIGILGLATLSYFKGQKTSLIIYIILLVAALVGFYFIYTGQLSFPSKN